MSAPNSDLDFYWSKYASITNPRPFAEGARWVPQRSLMMTGLVGLALLALPPAIGSTGAGSTDDDRQATISVASSQPEGSGLALTVGITPNGDGSSCGTETSVQVLKGTAIDVCYTVANNSSMALAYSTLDDSVDGNLFRYKSTAIPAGGTYTWHRPLFRAETSAQHRLTWTAQDIRPQYVPTAGPAAPTDFIDIRSTGILLPVSGGLNAAIQTPFRFTLYGVTSNAFCVVNNGFLVPAVTPSVCSVGAIGWIANGLDPTAPQGYGGQSGAVIAPFAASLYDDAGGVYFQVLGTAPNRQLVVEWDRPAQYCDPSFDVCYGTPGRANVEAILGEDGSIAYQYQTTDFAFSDPYSGGVWNSNIVSSIGLRNGQYGLWNPNDGQFFDQYSNFTQLPYPDPVAVTWTLTPPTLFVAQANATIQVGAPAVSLNPNTTIEPIAPSGSSAPVTVSLAIANTGDYALAWSAAQASGTQAPVVPAYEASASQPADTDVVAGAPFSTAQSAYLAQSGGMAPPALAAPDAVSATEQCGPDVPGALIYDDGHANNSWVIPPAANVLSVHLQKFTPLSYPATFGSACIALQTYLYPTSPAFSVDYDVVVYDSTGPGGSPGNLLGAVSTSAMSVGYPAYETFNNRVDISSLNLRVDSGSVYIGARWATNQGPQGASISVGFDDVQDGFLPPLPGGGPTDTWSAYYNTGTSPSFEPVYGTFYQKNVFMIRAVEAAPGCANPGSISWLSVSPSVGALAPGASGVTSVTFNPTGLADGIYSAHVCIGANYGVGASVPVSFAVGTPVAKADTYTAAAGATLTIAAPGVLANDLDPNGQGLTAVLTGTPAHGSLSLQPNGAFTYTPLPGFLGNDSFSYHTVDGETSSDATVTITVAQITDSIFANGFEL